jgi:hypothetical protein
MDILQDTRSIFERLDEHIISLNDESRTTLVSAIFMMLFVACIYMQTTLHRFEYALMNFFLITAAVIVYGVLAKHTDAVIAGHYGLVVIIMFGSWYLYSAPAKLFFTLIVALQVILFKIHRDRCPVSYVDPDRVHLAFPQLPEAGIEWLYYVMILYAMWRRKST